MHRLRQARHLARLVLAWFVLSLGVAVASPMVQPQGLEFICSGGAMKVLVKTSEGVKQVSTHTLDCPLCAHIGSPPPLETGFAAEPVQPLAHALRPVGAARMAWLAAAPLPARGPPSFS